MAAVHPYQRVLLANRDSLLTDLPTEDVINFLEQRNVLSRKETDDIEIGRSQRERRESLLDVLHYKGERGFNEFCKALDEYSPNLAAKMSGKDPQVERTEKYHNEVKVSSRYHSSYSSREREFNAINGDEFERGSDRDRYEGINEAESKTLEMKGEAEPQYAEVSKRPRDMDRDDRSVSSHHSHHSRRGDDYRKTPRRGDELNPAEHYILEKQTIHLEKANTSQGFGIAVSGGLDNPHNRTGDTSIVVSDIVKGSPADGLLRINDIIVQVNDVNVERCYHRDAVQALKDSGVSARLIIKRRKAVPGSIVQDGKMDHSVSDRRHETSTLPDKRSRSMLPTSVINLKKPEKEGFGFSMAFRLYVKDVKRKGVADFGGLQRDHVIQKINGKKTDEMSLKEAIDMVRKSQDLELVIAEKKLDRYSSTKSLPSVGKRSHQNGLDHNYPDEEPLDRRSDRRAKSLDRQYIKNQKRALHDSDDDRAKESKPKEPQHDGLSIEKPVVHAYETEIKPVEVKKVEQESGLDWIDEIVSVKTPEPLVTKLDAKVEESVPDLPPSEKIPETFVTKMEMKVEQSVPDFPQSVKIPEPLVTKEDVKVEESVPDLPQRRYSDDESPSQPPDQEDNKVGEPFGTSSWKHFEAGIDRGLDRDSGRDRDSDRGGRDRDSDRGGRDRDSDRGGRDRDSDRGGRDRDRYPDERIREEELRPVESEKQEYVPQPADVTRTNVNMDLSALDTLSPGRQGHDRSPGSTPQSQRKEKTMDFINDRDTKSIAFRKEGSLGIQIQGGNKVGIFVAAVRENNPAYIRGLRRGDQVLMANDIDFKDITREEAVLLLLSLGDEVHLYSRPKNSTFERIKNSPGDSFYIKVHFDYGKMKTDELDITREDVFHVWDTMYGGMIGSWHAQRVTLSNDETETGVIPNKCRAEQLATVRQIEEDKTPKKISRSNSLKRTNSLGRRLKKNYLFVSSDKLDKDSFIHTAREFKLPAYERVSLRNPGFVRPVVLLGAIADITRDKLLHDMPEVFAIPTAYGGFTPAGHETPTKSSRRTLSYSTIKAVVDIGKHCLLDIAPDEVEKLNYCQFYPIVIFLKPPNKNVVKEMRVQHGSGKESTKHVKKLYDNSVKLEEFYSNMFSCTVPAGPADDWYGRVKEEIRRQQDRKVWMSEDKFEQEEDMQFRMHPNRYSTGHEYDTQNDSPTARSSVSHPADEEIQVEASKELESAPLMFNGPQVEYRRYDDDRGRYDDDRGRNDDDRGRYDDDRGRYDDSRGRYDDERPYDTDIDRASRPGYKPHGNVVKVLPSSQEPGELRQSLKKTRPTSQDFADHPPDLQDGDDNKGREGLRKIEYEPRHDGPNPTELELKYRAESLRKVEAKPDVLNQYDERVGVKVSDLWAIDNEVKRDTVQPIEAVQIENAPDDLDLRLEELEKAVPTQPKPEPQKELPKPYKFESKPRNVVVDYRSEDRPESVVRTSYYPRRSYATVTHVESKSEPEIVRTQVVDRVESAPMENGFRSLPRDYGRRPEPESKEIYRAEVTIPRKESKPERPKSAYGYSTQMYAPKPYGVPKRSSSPPPRPAQPTNYDYNLSRREPEPRPSTYRSEYRPKVSEFESHVHKDESQIITSDFESLDDDTQVVATARGTFTSEGGVLSSPETGVSIHIPKGAIEPGKEQEIYFKVCKDNNIMPPLDADKGETLLSPLVMCGPHGTQFLKPVELRLPHCASMTPDGWSFALKSSDTPTGMPTQWRNVSLPGQENKDKCQVDPNSVSVLVDHF